MLRHSAADSDRRNPNRTCREPALPEEFFQKLRFQTAGRGEFRLALGVLEDAVHCLERNHGAADFLGRLFCWEAEQWFASRDRGPIFSFESICSILDLDPGRIRGELHRWRQRRLKGPRRAPLEKPAPMGSRRRESSTPPRWSSASEGLT
jgi:hypothetical protein